MTVDLASRIGDTEGMLRKRVISLLTGTLTGTLTGREQYVEDNEEQKWERVRKGGRLIMNSFSITGK